jgi:hypothetical protein
MQVMATQSAVASVSMGSTFSSISRTSTSGGVRPARSGSASGGASTLPRPHQPCAHEGDMISSLGLFLIGSHLLAAIRSPVVALLDGGNRQSPSLHRLAPRRVTRMSPGQLPPPQYDLHVSSLPSLDTARRGRDAAALGILLRRSPIGLRRDRGSISAQVAV